MELDLYQPSLLLSSWYIVCCYEGMHLHVTHRSSEMCQTISTSSRLPKTNDWLYNKIGRCHKQRFLHWMLGVCTIIPGQSTRITYSKHGYNGHDVLTNDV